MNLRPHIEPDWRWGTAEGSREFDRLQDRRMSFVEIVQWLEEAETFTLQARLRSSPGSTAPMGCEREEISPQSR